MERVSIKVIRSQFRFLMDLIGCKVADSYNDVGAMRIDKAYGGYNIELICTESGGVSHPFGHRRRSAKEFSAFLCSLQDWELYKKYNGKFIGKTSEVNHENV